MKQSEFNYVTRVGDDMYGIFNTYKNSLAMLTEEEMYHLDHLEEATEEELKNFKELNFVIEDDVDERAITEADTMKYANDNRIIIRILTTMDCNADCVYCYENRNHVKMSEETADKVVEFIKKMYVDHLHIEWFGGEPLFNKDIITYICKKLYDNNIEFTSSIVTNGILCNEEVVDLLEYWKITRMQITLDGVGDVYDKIKRVPTGTFRTVIRNIKNILDHKIDINIRMNYMNDVEVFKKLIDYMDENIGYHEYLHYYAYPVFGLSNDQKEFDGEIIDKIFEIQDYVLSKGLDKPEHLYNIQYKGMGCFATHKNGYTIGPDGNLHGCSHTEYEVVGNVVDGENELRKKYLAAISEKCKTCKLYPICKGGCKVSELGLQHQNQCLMLKNRFDDYVRKMVEHKYNSYLHNIIVNTSGDLSH